MSIDARGFTMDAQRFLRSSFRHLDSASIMRQPVDALLGVSGPARNVLANHGILTIFDLATATLFHEAAVVVASADDPQSDWAVLGMAPESVVDAPLVGLPLEAVADRPIQDLRALSEPVAAELAAALDVSTIRELAGWPAYLGAGELLRAVAGSTDAQGVWDLGTPSELVPTMGRHPTERVYYRTVLLDHFLEPSGESVEYRARPLEAIGQVDVTSPLLSSPGFDRMAVGAVVELSQSWYTAGLSLGQLLHSLALAPGESTRIAMIDWQRRESGSRSEAVSERDDLSSAQVHNRALNEVVNAVAREVQSGSSASQTSGESWGLGKSGGGGGSYGGEGQGYGFGGGYSIGYGTGKGQASSFSVSSGERDLRSELTQNVHDLTQQASTMARNRWATVVQEVSQQEHEQLSTRSVTNYNHMHALTIEYYEVVQLYRVGIAIERVNRCLFVPMQAVDFRRRDVVSRFRSVLARAGLIPQVRTLLSASADSLVLTLASPAMTWDLSSLALLYGPQAWSSGAQDAVIPQGDLTRVMIGTNDEGHPFRSLVVEFADGTSTVVPFTITDRAAPDGTPFGYFDFATVWPLEGSQVGLDRVRRVLLRRGTSGATYSGEVSFMLAALSVRGDGFAYCSVKVPVTPGAADVEVLRLDRGVDYSDVTQHLQENALHYSQAIWSSLDPTAISLALAEYTFGGAPLLEAIDPTPLMVTGNYMVFRTHVHDEEWAQFLLEKELRVGPVSSALVPLPSGGVFAEAVLGRSNAAEKLDLTRFWNWQDSPIPITAPEITALQAGSRTQPVDLDPEKLSPSVLNLVNPTPLPDPVGMSAALTALAQGAMFRDMSGLAGTIGLAGTSLQEAFQGSADAQDYAAQNFRTAASLVSRGPGRPSTVTEQGARTQQGRDMDTRERNDPGSVGPGERAAFQDSLSAPPLVGDPVQGSSPEEWAPWPGTTKVPRAKKRPTVIPVTVTFRTFVPSDLWLPHPSVVSAGPLALALRGDDRGFGVNGGRSLAELTYDFRIDADTLRVTEESPPKVQFGIAEIYAPSDSIEDGAVPWRRRRRNVGAQPIMGLSTRLQQPADGTPVLGALSEEVAGAVSVILSLHGKPHFPWQAEDLDALPDLELAGATIKWLMNQMLNAAIHDLDARVVLTLRKRPVDGVIIYDVAGWHDQFPAYEVYVNGEPAYQWGSDADLADPSAPERLIGGPFRETISVGAPRALKIRG